MKTSSLVPCSHMPAWPMILPSSVAVVKGGEGVVFEADGGRTMTNARVPLFGDVIMVSRYSLVWETMSKGVDLRSHRSIFRSEPV